VGEVELSLLRPSAPEDLLDEEAFEHDEFLPYWAELWPAASALTAALPTDLRGARVVELGCGLGVPSLVAAARGAEVVATDWAADAIDLLQQNAKRNGIDLEPRVWDWRAPWEEHFDLAIAADVLYELRNVEPLVSALCRLASEALIGLAGRPYEQQFLNRVDSTEIAERVVRVRAPDLRHMS
jgi:predicted nicotinamide N-methyase